MAEGKSASKTLVSLLRTRGFNVRADEHRDEDDYWVLRLVVPKPLKAVRLAKEALTRTAHALRNGLWPVTPRTLVTLVGAVTLTTVAAETDSWLRSGWVANALWRLDELVLQRFFARPLGIRWPTSVRVAYLASSATFAAVYVATWLERLVLRSLLGWTGYLFRTFKDDPNVPWDVRAWAYVVRALSGSKKMTYGFQQALPRLPVPRLRDTLDRYLESVELLLTPDAFARVSALAKQFETNEGPKLQRLLWLQSWTTNNYVTPWWERFAYLANRDPLAINSSYYVMDCVVTPVRDQVFRAANLVHHLVRFQLSIEQETLEPSLLRDTVPLSMDQYERMFGTTRVPLSPIDAIRHTRNSRHIVVVARRSRLYRLRTTHEDDTILSPAEFAHQLRVIVEHASLVEGGAASSLSSVAARVRSGTLPLASDGAGAAATAASSSSSAAGGDADPAPCVMALSSLPRDRWARLRADLIDAHDGNAAAMHIVDTAAFVLHLETLEASELMGVTAATTPPSPTAATLAPSSSASAPGGPAPPPPTPSRRKLLRRARALFHGRSDSLFFDKSINLVVFDDGFAGMCVEHSWGDAPITAHAWEHALLSELVDVEREADASARAGESLRGPALPLPTSFEFHASDALRREARKARRLAKERIKDLELDIMSFEDFGQSFPKRAVGVSPDAFVQAALQLAYFWDRGRLDLTYESCTTKIFCEGRTETIRSLTREMADFVREFVGAKAPPSGMSVGERSKLVELLKVACVRHQRKSREAMSGRGCDRHLFALYVAAKGTLKTPSPFLETAFGNAQFAGEDALTPWRLSTSQQPQHQTKLRDGLPKRAVDKFVSPGGGFGPIEDDGYGIAYTFAGDHVMFFHITCKRAAAPLTDAKRFAGHIRRALLELRELVSSSVTAQQ